MRADTNLSEVVGKFPGIFSNKRNRRQLFHSRDKTYIVEETKLQAKTAYQVIQVTKDITLKTGKFYKSLEDLEATYAIELNF